MNLFFVFLTRIYEKINAMNTQKTILYLLFCIVFFSCKKGDNDTPLPAVDKYNVDIGEFYLLDESIEATPYFGKQYVTFVDSLGNKMKFHIDEKERSLSKTAIGTLYRYNVYEQGDTVRYFYTKEYKYCKLTTPSADLGLTISLSAQPYYFGPNNQGVSDKLQILYERDIEGKNSTSLAFYITIDGRTLGFNYAPSQELSEITFFNKTFEHVFYLEFLKPKSLFYFNYEVGIVAFRDPDGKMWRFERFIE